MSGVRSVNRKQNNVSETVSFGNLVITATFSRPDKRAYIHFLTRKSGQLGHPFNVPSCCGPLVAVLIGLHCNTKHRVEAKAFVAYAGTTTIMAVGARRIARW